MKTRFIRVQQEFVDYILSGTNTNEYQLEMVSYYLQIPTYPMMIQERVDL